MPPLDKRYPPLSTDQLRAIWKRSPSPAVRVLLWEIYRLRSVIVQTNWFIRKMDRIKHANKLDPVSTKALDELRVSISREPVIKEEPKNDLDD